MKSMQVSFIGVASSVLFVLGCSDDTPNDVKNAESPKIAEQELVDEVFSGHEIEEAALKFSKESVEQRLIEAQEWGDLDLKTIGPGKYMGDATTRDDAIFNVEVRQTSEGIYARWTTLDKTGGGVAMITW